MMRRFTIEEEQALLLMLRVPGARWMPIPVKPGPCAYVRLASSGCARVMQDGPVRKARLSATGRYFAGLLRDGGVAIADPPGMIRRRMG